MTARHRSASAPPPELPLMMLDLELLILGHLASVADYPLHNMPFLTQQAQLRLRSFLSEIWYFSVFHSSGFLVNAQGAVVELNFY